MISFSPSSLSTYRDCPRKFKLTKDKIIVWKESPAKARGTQLHSYMESQVKQDNKVLLAPDGIQMYYAQDLINKFRNVKNNDKLTLLLEHEMAVDNKWQSCGWFDQNVMLRAKADVLIMDQANNSMLIGDYKTGKIYPGMDYQVRVYALMCYVLYGMQHIKWELYYIDQGKTKSGALDLEHGLESLNDILQDMNRAVYLEQTGGLFEARRNQFCRFCQVYRSKLYCRESMAW